MAVEQLNNDSDEPEHFDVAEWDTDRLRSTAKHMFDDLRSMEWPTEARDAIEHDLGHLVFEMWCRKREQADG